MRPGGALFWSTLVFAGLLVIRPILRATGAPTPVRLVIGIAFVCSLLAVAGLLVARRVNGEATAPQALGGLGLVALFLVVFALAIRGRTPLWADFLTVTVVGAGIIAVGLRASATDQPV